MSVSHNKPIRRSNSSSSPGKEEAMRCFKCNGIWHCVRDCEERNKERSSVIEERKQIKTIKVVELGEMCKEVKIRRLSYRTGRYRKSSNGHEGISLQRYNLSSITRNTRLKMYGQVHDEIPVHETQVVDHVWRQQETDVDLSYIENENNGTLVERIMKDYTPTRKYVKWCAVQVGKWDSRSVIWKIYLFTWMRVNGKDNVVLAERSQENEVFQSLP